MGEGQAHNVKSMEEPLVSVLMTAYNREKFIGEAIESVLDSSYANFELIIVDDRSTDATVRIAQYYAGKDSRVKVYINETNLGDYPNRNRAASHAGGKYIKYLDSDDLIYRHGLEALVHFMEIDQEAGMGISYKKNVTHKPFPLVMKPSESLRHHFFVEGFLDCGPTGTIIRREIFEKTGGFSGKRMIGDLEFALKLAKRHKVMILPPSLSFWRNHGDQEMSIGIANDMYASMTREVLQEQFADLPDNVLTEAERHEIIRRVSGSDRRERYKKFIKRILFLRK
jgi:glycosyltransferase involved in cell wall biosynthesis